VKRNTRTVIWEGNCAHCASVKSFDFFWLRCQTKRPSLRPRDLAFRKSTLRPECKRATTSTPRGGKPPKVAYSP